LGRLAREVWRSRVGKGGWGVKDGGGSGDRRGSCQGSVVTRPVMTSVRKLWYMQGVVTRKMSYLRLQSHQELWSCCDRVEF